jgi:hypothetical protein
LQEAVKSVGEAKPWTEHQHIDTNQSGSKRAHVLAPAPPSQAAMQPAQPVPVESFPFQTSQPFPTLSPQRNDMSISAASVNIPSVNGLSASQNTPLSMQPALSAGAASYQMQMAAVTQMAPPPVPEPVQSSFAGQLVAPVASQPVASGIKVS